MDCKTESAVRTCLRIEVIVIQGLTEGLLGAVLAVVLAPTAPFVLAARAFWTSRKRLRLWRRILMLPWWWVRGLLMGVSLPFVILYEAVVGVLEVARVEWATRWMSGEPKKPNGHPMPIRSTEEETLIDLAVMRGVIKDYNGEARRHGQGLPVDERKL